MVKQLIKSTERSVVEHWLEGWNDILPVFRSVAYVTDTLWDLQREA